LPVKKKLLKHVKKLKTSIMASGLMIIHKEPIKHMPQLCWGSTHKGEDRMRDVHFADMLYQWQNTKITAEDIDIVAEDIDIVKRNPCLSFRQKRQIIKLIKNKE